MLTLSRLMLERFKNLKLALISKSAIMKKTLPVFVLLFVCCAHAQTYQPTWESLDSRSIPEWYRNGKFGIFIHWGVYSVPGFCPKGGYAEWYQNGLMTGDTARIAYHKKKFGDRTYYDLSKDFKAELFNPDEWARIFEASGAKYIVLTSKHHDGFCLWPSKDANRDWGFAWNAVDAGPHRDLLGDLFTAVRKTAVHAGMYYSLYEWYNPLWLKDKPKYVAEHMWPQMKELVNTYQPDVFWTDGDWEGSDSLWKSREFLAWLYNESPVKDRVVTYDRWGSGIRFRHGEVFTPEYQPELSFEDHYWEENRGMGFSYGYNRQEDAWDYNSPQSLVLQLIDKVSRGGNFLLDIGPDEHGKIPPIMQERLLQIGSWMKINNEAIYNTTSWKRASQWSTGKTDYKPKDNSGDLLLKLTVDPDPGYAVKECFFTFNPSTNNLYLLLPKYPSDKKFVVHDLKVNPGTKIDLLETGQALGWEQEGNDLEIRLPEFDPNKVKSQYAFVLKLEHTGAFALKPSVEISYPKNSLRPLITIISHDNSAIYYTLDGSAPTLGSRLYSTPFSLDKSSVLMVKAFKNDLLSSQVVSLPAKVFSWQAAEKMPIAGSGLKMTAYEAVSLQSVDELQQSKMVKTAVSKNISLRDTSRKEQAGLIYEGVIKVPKNGIYSFYLSSDDGSKLWIGHQLVIDNDGSHGDQGRNGGVALKKGVHAFKLAYFNGVGEAALQLRFGVDGGTERAIPDNYFFY
jgi:alpha-L-fucosidase